MHACRRDTTIPLIHYGMIGTNLFEDFDCAYCLSGYYTKEEVVGSILHDVVASDGIIPVKITTGGHPRRRRAVLVNPEDRYYDVGELAQLALLQQEMNVVLQAVGRVRPYTRPREVITFQCSEHPTMAYTAEFNSLGEAREYFGIPSCRDAKKQEAINRVRDAKQKGQTQVEAAEQLGVSLSTVERYWKQGMASRSL